MQLSIRSLLALIGAGLCAGASAQWHAAVASDGNIDLPEGVRCRMPRLAMPRAVTQDPTFRRGAVLLQAELVPPGRVGSAMVRESSGYAELDEAALAEFKSMDCQLGTPLAKATIVQQKFVFSQGGEAPIPLQPESARAFRSLGIYWASERSLDKAIESFDQAIRVSPTYADAYASRAAVWRLSGNAEKALADFDEAIRLNPRDVRSHLQRANLQTARLEFSAALDDVEAALRVNPDSVSRLSLGRLRFMAGKFSLAAEDLGRGVQERPQYAYGHLWLFLAQARVGDAKRAGEELTAGRSGMDGSTWPMPVIDFYLGRVSSGAMLAAADTPDARTRNEHLCEANFYLAEWHLLQHNVSSARPLLGTAGRDCPDTFVERSAAAAEIKRLPAD